MSLAEKFTESILRKYGSGLEENELKNLLVESISYMIQSKRSSNGEFPSLKKTYNQIIDLAIGKKIDTSPYDLIYSEIFEAGKEQEESGR